jgi:hypothetical protein
MFICLSTKVGVTGLNVKVSVFVLGLFVFIACILGWFSSITVFGFPIFLATFMKKSFITHPAPFMNKGLRQEIYKKRTLHNKFLKQKTNKNWEAYRKQRNFVNKLKKKSDV